MFKQTQSMIKETSSKFEETQSMIKNIDKKIGSNHHEEKNNFQHLKNVHQTFNQMLQKIAAGTNQNQDNHTQKVHPNVVNELNNTAKKLLLELKNGEKNKQQVVCNHVQSKVGMMCVLWFLTLYIFFSFTSLMNQWFTNFLKILPN